MVRLVRMWRCLTTEALLRSRVRRSGVALVSVASPPTPPMTAMDTATTRRTVRRVGIPAKGTQLRQQLDGAFLKLCRGDAVSATLPNASPSHAGRHPHQAFASARVRIFTAWE